MKQHRASLTSEMVAAYRALHLKLHHPPVLVDPYAEKLVGPMWWLPLHSKLAYRLLVRAGFRFDWAIAQCMARNRIAEDRLDDLRRQGPAQWVLLGAGLDMFAWRRKDIAGLPQFETDHPATQRGKRKKLAALGLSSPPSHHFVAVDFERDTASQKLREAGFTSTIPTVFAWLGVTYYLQRAAIEGTLRDVRSVAAPGSFLVFDYRRPDRYLRAEERGPVSRADRAFAKWGEPMVSKVERDDIVAMAQSAGWRVHAEHSPDDVARRFFDGGRDGLRPMSTYHVLELTTA